MRKKIKYCFCIAALLIATACSTNAPRVVEDFNFDWKFKLGDNPSTPGGGALPGGIGWYRKSFATPDGVPGKRVYVEFDGVFMNSTVWVNGEEMGTRPYGYSSFTYDITDALYTDGYDLSYITVQAVDDQGRPVDNATDMLQFGVSGAGELVGVDNGNPIDHDCLKGTKKALFSGKALAVVRSVKGQKGNITLTVQGLGNSYKIDIKTR